MDREQILGIKIGQGYKIGAMLLLGGFLFKFLETWYFGWNISPQSISEMKCDFIGALLMLLGYVAIVWCQKKERDRIATYSRQNMSALLDEIERLQKIEAKAKEVIKVMAPWYSQKGKQMPEPMVVVETLSNLARII